MKSICIVPCIGIPGVGKTTLVKFMINNIGKDFPYYIIHIDYDNILRIIKSRMQNHEESYHDIRNDISRVVFHLVQTLQYKSTETLTNIQQLIFSTITYELSSNNVLIIIDDNLYYRSMRYDYYKICKKLEISYYQLFVCVDLHVALQRNSCRTNDSKIPPEIIKRMAVRLEIPNPKNHWEINTLNICSEKDFTKDTLLAISSMAKEMFQQPLKNIVKPIQITEQSLLHKLDLLLRKHVHEILQQIHCDDKSNMKSISGCLNEKRREILNNIKLGILVVSEESIHDFVVDNMQILDLNLK